ncbi:hypothetical protein HG530_008491 [Fusarium avenaceum]|nr:hypothetical protein HG530_008491 [Fusarium avenaceum]
MSSIVLIGISNANAHILARGQVVKNSLECSKMYVERSHAQISSCCLDACSLFGGESSLIPYCCIICQRNAHLRLGKVEQRQSWWQVLIFCLPVSDGVARETGYLLSNGKVEIVLSFRWESLSSVGFGQVTNHDLGAVAVKGNMVKAENELMLIISVGDDDSSKDISLL